MHFTVRLSSGVQTSGNSEKVGILKETAAKINKHDAITAKTINHVAHCDG
jgi:hypothetical protein